MYRKLGCLTVLLFLVFSLKSQPDTIYFNGDGEVIVKEFADFYRICLYDTAIAFPLGNFQDYYFGTSRILSSGAYINNLKHGLFSTFSYEGNPYYEVEYYLGKVRKMTTYSEIDKQIEIQLKIDNGALKIIQWNDPSNNPIIANGSGIIDVIRDGVVIKGEIKDSLLAGTWIIMDGVFVFKEKYKKGVLKSGLKNQGGDGQTEYDKPELLHYIVNTGFFDEIEKLEVSSFYRKRDYKRLDKMFTPRWERYPQKDQFFTVKEAQPFFPGGQEFLIGYLNSKFYYPSQAKDNDIKGTVIVKFLVDVDGQVKNPEIIKGLGYGCDEVVLEMFKEIPDWIPGQQAGEPVPVEFVMPIEFE